MEATGGLEIPLASTLVAHQLPVAVVNPRQVRDFAKATGTLAKTDAIDARVLARFAGAVRPEVRKIKDENTLELSALVTRRRQLISMLTAEKTRLRQAPQWIQKDIKDHIRSLQQRLKRIDKELSKTIKKSSVWHETIRSFKAFPEPDPFCLSTCWRQFRNRLSQSTSNRGARGRRPAQPRQRTVSRQTLHLGRPRQRPSRPLHGRRLRDAIQPHHPRLLSAVNCKRKTF